MTAQHTPASHSREQQMVLSATNQCALDGRPVRSLLWGRGYAIAGYDDVLTKNAQQLIDSHRTGDHALSAEVEAARAAS